MKKPISRPSSNANIVNIESVIESLNALNQNPTHPNASVIFSQIFDFFEKDNTVPEQTRKYIGGIIADSDAWQNLQRNQEFNQRLSALRVWHKNYLEDKKTALKYVLPDVPTELQREIANLEHKLKIINGGWTVLYKSPWYNNLFESDKSIIQDCFSGCNPTNHLNRLKNQAGKGRRKTSKRRSLPRRRKTSKSRRKTLKRRSSPRVRKTSKSRRKTLKRRRFTKIRKQI